MSDLSCPTCRKPLTQAGYTDRCKQCDGAWVHEDTLVGMLQERTSALVFLPWQPRAQDKERVCAVCAAPMSAVSLADVALDRCTQHGVWFDALELSTVLSDAKLFKSDAVHDDGSDAEPDKKGREGILGALAKLFGG